MNNQIIAYKPKLDENGKPVVRYAEGSEPWLDASNGRLKFTATVLPVPIYEQLTDGWLMEPCDSISEHGTHVRRLSDGAIFNRDQSLRLNREGAAYETLTITPLAQPDPTAEQRREKARIVASDAAHSAFSTEWMRLGSGTSSCLNRALEAYQDAYEDAMKENI